MADEQQPRVGTVGPRPPRVYAALLGLIALGLLYGGVLLVGLKGSPYYLVAGIALAASAVLLWRGRRAGLWLYAAIVVVTIGWAFWEVGFSPWALMPRIVAWLVVGAWMLVPSFRRRLGGGPHHNAIIAHGARWTSFAVAILAAVAIGAILHLLTPARFDPRYQNGTAPYPSMPSLAADTGGGDWLEWGRDKAGSRFSPLTQINASNVQSLERAWTAPIAINPKAATAGVEATPLMIGDTLYTCNGLNEVFAIDAETGQRRWQAQPAGDHGRTCRGLAYYKTLNATGPCAERIIAATGVATLVAYDRQSGRLCPGFGRNGTVDLLAGLSKAPKGYYFVTSAPAVVRGRIVLGGWVTDGQYWGEPSGVIRAFDAVTGALSWAWDMGRPDRTGAPAPGETYTPSTPNSWAPISADERLGLVYLPTGSASADYVGMQRRPFDEKYGASVVALDVETGRLRWSFQTTHHDVWDYDVPSQPMLIDLPKPGGGIEQALLQSTKRGEIFLLDRRTGQPLRKVVERPVPQGHGVPGERLSPTQPFSEGMPSFRIPDMRENDMWGITPLDQLACRIQFRRARYEGPMTPPGLTPWISVPGTTGGMNWGSAAIDRDHHVMIVPTGNVAYYSRLITRKQADAQGLKPIGDYEFLKHAGGGPQANTPYAAEASFFLSPLFAPCQAPPYGMISAVDLVSGKLIWSRPLGSARDMGPLGLPTMLPLPLGTPLIGGPIATRAGLVFIAASGDRTLRALDIRTGKSLWQAYLPHGGFATPMTYISPKSGRQFVVVSTGSLYGLGTPSGAALVAFALPKQ